MSDEPLRIWWNKNLHGKITPGKLAAHAAHAALAAYGIEYEHPIVVLAAGKGRIEQMPVTIHDAGYTELAPGTLTTGVEERRVLTHSFTDAELAAHDREVTASALEDFADLQENLMAMHAYAIEDGDVEETASWCKSLRARAASIREGGKR